MKNEKRMLNILITEAHNWKISYQTQLNGQQEIIAETITTQETNSLVETISRTTTERKNERYNDLLTKLQNSRQYLKTYKNKQTNWVKNIMLSKSLNYNTKDGTKLDQFHRWPWTRVKD